MKVTPTYVYENILEELIASTDCIKLPIPIMCYESEMFCEVIFFTVNMIDVRCSEIALKSPYI
jgi:hypothetical protein